MTRDGKAIRGFKLERTKRLLVKVGEAHHAIVDLLWLPLALIRSLSIRPLFLGASMAVP